MVNNDNPASFAKDKAKARKAGRKGGQKSSGDNKRTDSQVGNNNSKVE